nr:hypothetical protein LK20_00056 [Oryctes rhinoceros nudivirus]
MNRFIFVVLTLLCVHTTISADKINVSVSVSDIGLYRFNHNTNVFPKLVRFANNHSALWFSSKTCPIRAYNYNLDERELLTIKILNVDIKTEDVYPKAIHNDRPYVEMTYAIANFSKLNKVYYFEFPSKYNPSEETQVVLWIYTRPHAKIDSGFLTKSELLECLAPMKLARLAEYDVGLTKYGQPRRYRKNYISLHAYKTWFYIPNQNEDDADDDDDEIDSSTTFKKHSILHEIIGSGIEHIEQNSNKSIWYYIGCSILTVLSTLAGIGAAYRRLRNKRAKTNSSGNNVHFDDIMAEDPANIDVESGKFTRPPSPAPFPKSILKNHTPISSPKLLRVNGHKAENCQDSGFAYNCRLYEAFNPSYIKGPATVPLLHSDDELEYNGYQRVLPNEDPIVKVDVRNTLKRTPSIVHQPLPPIPKPRDSAQYEIPRQLVLPSNKEPNLDINANKS